ncbi:RICIN domain-containing protein [Streptomyces daliensis]|uniref:Ricin-type beta-trefoil lectin domain protein n=1 Tax=Streptomyces daliensis TaxID=299421 RepID=A0A8T4IW28_9ACTN|nr:ricin-type beta-trefoil lectin domain protein [Streptomyces daliensis]
MNRGDDADEPAREYEPLTPASPADLGRLKSAGEGSGASPAFSVVISGDGSAVIDGDPVPVVPGEELDVAILDTLHGYARSRNAPVTAAISDPAAEYVAVVEVQPDGASKLLDQVYDEAHADAAAAVAGAGAGAPEPTEQAAPAPPVPEQTAPAPAPEPVAPAPGPEQAVQPPAPEQADATSVMPVVGTGPAAPVPPVGTGPAAPVPPAAGHEAEGLEPSKPSRFKPSMPSMPSMPSFSMGKGSSSKSKSSSPMSTPSFRAKGGQSDDEYQQPGLMERPLVMGGVAVSIVVLVVGSLVALGSGGSEGEAQQNKATGAENEAGKPKKPKQSTYPDPTSPSRSAESPSPKSGLSSPSPKKKSDKKDSGKDKPKDSPKADKDVPIPTGAVVLKNHFGFCADLPGQGKGQINQQIIDERECGGSAADNQRWKLDKSPENGPGGVDLYLIRNIKDGFCFDLGDYGPRQVGTKVAEYHCDASNKDNQLWWFDKRPDGAYWIRNHKSGDLCLTPDRWGTKTENVDLQLGVCDNSKQEWTFKKV